MGIWLKVERLPSKLEVLNCQGEKNLTAGLCLPKV
jgi:hypothetical protein